MEKKWFRAKRYGWGWYPATWQGWLVILGYVVIFLSAELYFIKYIEENQSFIFIASYLLFVLLLTSTLIWICYKTGEQPGWRWGNTAPEEAKRKNKLLIFIIMLITLTLISSGIIFTNYQTLHTHEIVPSTSDTKLYVNETYGLQFKYPTNYHIEEKETGNGERNRHSIILTDQKLYEESRDVSGGEGPVSITMDIFQNDIDKMSLVSFVTGTNDSNYKLSPDETYSTTTVAGSVALQYHWSGLYEGESVVFDLNGDIVMASVTYVASTDSIRNDFKGIIDTLDFLPLH